MARRWGLGAIFLFFGYVLLFSGGGRFLYFPIFPILGQRPAETYSVAGQRGLKPRA